MYTVVNSNKSIIENGSDEPDLESETEDIVEIANHLIEECNSNDEKSCDIPDLDSDTEYLIEVQEDDDEMGSESNQNQIFEDSPPTKVLTSVQQNVEKPEKVVSSPKPKNPTEFAQKLTEKTKVKTLKTERDSKSLYCNICNRLFTSDWSLDFHTDTKHSEKPLFTKEEIDSWMIGCLKNKTIFECPICNYKSNKKNNLVRHVWRHSYQTKCAARKKLTIDSNKTMSKENFSGIAKAEKKSEVLNSSIKLNTPVKSIKQESYSPAKMSKTPKRAINALGKALQTIEKSLATPGTSSASPKKTLNALAKTLTNLKETLDASATAPIKTEREKVWKSKELFKYTCNHCNKNFSEKHIRDFHVTMFHSANPITNEEVASCMSKRTVNGELKKVYSCNHCQHETFKATSFKMHLWRHRNVNRSTIRKNLQESKDVKNLKNVLSNPSYSCHVCEKEFFTETSYLYHYFQSHTDGKFSAKQIESFKQNNMFKCFKDDCDYATPRGSFFRIHMFRHLQKKFKGSLEGTEADPEKRFIGNKEDLNKSIGGVKRKAKEETSTQTPPRKK